MSVNAFHSKQGKPETSRLGSHMAGKSVWGTNIQENRELAKSTANPDMLKQMASEILSGEDLNDADGEILEELIQNPNLLFADALQLALSDHNSHIYVNSLLQRPDAKEEALNYHIHCKQVGSQNLFDFVANHAKTPDSTLLRMARSHLSEEAVAAVKSGRLSEDFLEGLSHSEDFRVREAVAYITKNPKMLEQMSEYNIPFVRNAIVINPNAETQLIEKLAAEPNCPLAKLEAAKRSKNEGVLRDLGNGLLKNYDADIANALKQNASAPEDVRVVVALLRQ